MLSASTLGFISSFVRKRAVHNRLKALRSAALARSRWHTVGVAGLVGLMAVCGLTDASTPEAPPARSPDWLPLAGHDGSKWDGVLQADPGPSVTRTYDIEKALNRIAADERTEADARVKLNSVLIHILRSSTGQYRTLTDEWAQERLTLDGPNLTINAPLNAHAEIVRNLRAWEQSGLCQISVGTCFITDERDITSAVGVSWRYLEAFSADREYDRPSEPQSGMPVVSAKAAVDDYLPIAVAILKEPQALALMQAVRTERCANVRHAPKVTLFNGQLASILDLSQTPFVVGLRDASAGVPQPKIAVVDEGIKLSLRAIQSSDSSKVQLDARVELSEIGEVRTASTLVRGEPITIQIPRVKRCRIDVSSEVQAGQSVLIGCIPTYEQKRFFYVLLTVNSVSPRLEEMD
jgi:hypothetical protein